MTVTVMVQCVFTITVTLQDRTTRCQREIWRRGGRVSSGFVVLFFYLFLILRSIRGSACTQTHHISGKGKGNVLMGCVLNGGAAAGRTPPGGGFLHVRQRCCQM